MNSFFNNTLVCDLLRLSFLKNINNRLKEKYQSAVNATSSNV